MKNLRLYIVDILEKFLKDKALNKNYNAEKDDLKILRWPFVTSNDLWGYTSPHKTFGSL